MTATLTRRTWDGVRERRRSATRLLAVVPARGGSKGLPGKNLRPLAGKPLIAWTVEAACQAACVDRVVVSTEDAEIAEVARRYGADVPFRRPAALAGDAVPGTEPVVHATQWLAEHEGYRADYVVLLQPTSPLRRAEDIEVAMSLARTRDAEAVISVSPAGHAHPWLMKRVLPDGRLKDVLPHRGRAGLRQQLPAVYVLNGAIYLARRHGLLRRRSFDAPNTLAYVMPPERSVDIDTAWDFRIAELVLRDGSHRALR